jgi:hypothetical protein
VGFLRSLFARRRELPGSSDDEFPAAWRVIIAANVAHWRVLNASERARLEDLTWVLLAEKRWEAARGFELTDEIRVTIAAQAALLTLGLDDDAYVVYDDVTGIIVHPTTMTFAEQRAGPVAGTVSSGPFPIVGRAHHRGPVLIAWDAALAGARHPERGHNVVYHEFAHKLDMLDGVINGTPPLATDTGVAEWVEVCTAEYDALRAGEGGPLLDGYGGTNPAEFFAVATEVFFDRPVELEQEKPKLYAVLRGFFRQDPAARCRRTP